VVEKSCHTAYRATIDRYNINFDIAIEEFSNKGKETYCVENCSFHSRNNDSPNFLLFFPICHFCFLFNCYLQCFDFFVFI